MSKQAAKKKCRGCRRQLTASYCWPNSNSGWGYLYCENSKCGVPSTERQGDAP